MQEPPDAEYWRDHALKPVRFVEAMRALGRYGRFRVRRDRTGQYLACAWAAVRGRRCSEAWLGSLGNRGELRTMLTSLGELYRRGYDVDWEGFNRSHPGRLASLPTYPFEHRSFWIES